MIKRSHIQQFLAVVETGSFTLAAQRIRVTQPTLSAGIAQLEREVGAQLFVRDRRHVRLTDAGGHFLPIARELQRAFRAADAFSTTATADWPQLKIGVIKTIDPRTLEEVITALAGRLSIEVLEGSDSELRSAMASGRIDAALGLLRTADLNAGAIPLLEEPFELLVRESHRLSGHALIEPEDLSSEVMIARRSCEYLDETSRIFTNHGIRPRFALRSDNDERCLLMVSAGAGVTTAPRSLARPGIVGVKVRGYNLTRTIGLRRDPLWIQTPAGAIFLDCVPAMAQAFARPPSEREHRSTG